MNLWRVTYINVLDGKRHVLINALDRVTAARVAANARDKNGYAYMGPGVTLEPCDGTPDGAIIKEARA